MQRNMPALQTLQTLERPVLRQLRLKLLPRLENLQHHRVHQCRLQYYPY